MWFEIIWLICAAVTCRNFGVKLGTQGMVCFTAPIFFILLYKQSFSVNCLLAGYLVVFVLLLCRYFKVAGRLKITIRYLIKSCIVIVPLAVIKDYAPSDPGAELSREEVLLFYIVITVLLVFAQKIKCGINEKGYQAHVFLAALAALIWGFLITEKTYNENFVKMDLRFAAINLLWMAFFIIVLYCIIPYKRCVTGLLWTGCLVFGIANFYVAKFRGSPLTPVDLLSAGTAVQVAGEYEYEITGQIVTGVLYWYTGLTALYCIPVKKWKTDWKKKVIIASLSVCICMGGLCFIKIEDMVDWKFSQWNIQQSYKTAGSVFGFTALLQKLSVGEPNGYSIQRAEELLQEYKPIKTAQTSSPTVIVIMDETFSDLRTLGDFTCSDEYLEHWYAADDYVKKGKLYVSVYGGNTANTEFEFLTGCSMGNCPTGIIPYQSYNLKDVDNLANILNRQGYQATAVHPENKRNWNRMRVYDYFGFQDFLGWTDFEHPVYIRNHISDQSCFDQVIGIYEKGAGKRQFIFNITMQNHGGYNIEDLLGQDVIKLKKKWESYTDVSAYLTLVRESDKAIQNLLDYFRNVEEPVVICIFGDHLPALDEEWVEEVMKKSEESLTMDEYERKYAVPYMIWTNYDTLEGQQEIDTSANYLGAWLLETAGLRQSAYTNFLLNMSKNIPVLNAFGYQTRDGNWHTFEEETDVSGWIEDYRILQYYTMFDKKRDMENSR